MVSRRLRFLLVSLLPTVLILTSLFPGVSRAASVAGGPAPRARYQSQPSTPLDNPLLAEEWFYGQRTGPGGTIPTGAYAAALGQAAALPHWSPGSSTSGSGTSPVGTSTTPGVPATTTWQNLGPSPISGEAWSQAASGRVSALAVSPNGTLYAGTAGGGLWSSTNNGQTWTPLTDSQPSLSIGAIAVAPSNPQVIYVGTGEDHLAGDSFYGMGVLRSTDGGKSWTDLGSSIFDGQDISRVLVDPTDANTVYVAGSIGLYKSTDGGLSWTDIGLVAFANTNVSDLSMDPQNPQVVWAAVPGSGIWKTSDGGTTWVSGQGLPSAADIGNTALAVAPSAPNVVYASIAGPGPYAGDLVGMYASSDGGSTWSQLTATPDYFSQSYFYGSGTAAQGWYDNTLAVNPTHPNEVVAGGIGLAETTDGGQTWVDLNGATPPNPAGGPYTIHPDQHALAFDSQGDVYIGNDGGVWEITALGALNDLNTNLSVTQFYPGMTVEGNGSTILAGAQDNGTLQYLGVPGWAEMWNGDGGMTAADATGQDVMAETPPGNLAWSTDGGQIFTPIQNVGNVNQPNWVAPIAMDPNFDSNGILYYGAGKVWRGIWISGSWSWTQLATHGPASSGQFTGVSAITIDPGNNQVLAAGWPDGTMQVSTDGGNTWSTVSSAFPVTGKWITDIAIEPTSNSTPYNLYVTVSGFGVPQGSQGKVGAAHVLESTDGGTTWTDLSGNLPNAPANAVLPTAQGPVVGTDVGVFIRPNGSTSWSALGTGLPNTQVVDLKLDQNGNLYAATHGRGVWMISGLTPIAAPTSTTTVTGISPTTGPSTGGTTVTITGTGFTGSTSVHFGTAAAQSFTVDNPNTIDAVSPAGTGGTIADVTVSSPDGTSATSAADQFSYTNETSVTGVQVSLTDSGAGDTSSYTVTFTPTTPLTAGTDTITLAGPTGTVFTTNPTDYTVGGTSVTVTPTQTAGNNVTLTIPAGVSAPSGQPLAVDALNVTNPTSPGTDTLTVTTSQDLGQAASPPYTIAWTNVSFGLVDNSAGFTTSEYTIDWTEDLALTGGSGTVTLTGPAGTKWPTTAGDYTFTDVTNSAGSGPVTAPPQVNGATVTLTVPNAISAGDQMGLDITNVTNPITASTTDTLSLSTSVDPTLATSSPYAITATSTVGPGTSTISASPATVPNDGSTASTVTVVAKDPYGNPIANATVTLQAAANSAAVSPSQATTNSEGVATFQVTDTVAEQITYTPTINGGSINDTAKVTFGTASTSTTYDLTSSSDAPGAPSNYDLTFQTGNSGDLAVGSGTITLEFPSGTDLSSATFSVCDDTITCPNGQPISVTPQITGGTAVLTVPMTIYAGDVVDIYANGVTNPSTTGLVTFYSWTSSEPTPQVFPYTITSATAVGPSSVTLNPGIVGQADLWTVSFVATNGIASGGSITLDSPDTPLSTNPSDYQVTDTPSGGPAGSPVTPVAANLSGTQVTLTLPVSFSAANGDTISVQTSVTADPTQVQLYAVGVYDSTDTQEQYVYYTPVAGPADQANSSIVVATPTEWGNGNAYDLVTVKVADTYLNQVAGDTVTLAPSSLNSAVFCFDASTQQWSSQPCQATADGNGDAFFEVSDHIAEQVTYTASDPNITIGTRTVTFSNNIVTGNQILLSSGAAGTTSTYTINFSPATALAAGGQIILQVTPPNGVQDGSLFPAMASAYMVTDNGGSATAVTVEPTVTAAGAPGTPQTATVTLTTPIAIGAGDSVTVTVTGVENPPTAGTYTMGVFTSSDDQSTALNYLITGATGSVLYVSSSALNTYTTSGALSPITIGLEDGSGNVVVATSNVIVDLASSSGTGVFAATPGGTPITQVTIPQGQSSVQVYYGDSTAGSPVITPKPATGETGYQSSPQQETITQASVDATTSTVSASPGSVPADGSTTSTITVTAKDSGGTPVQGQAVTLGQGTGSSTLTVVQGTTDATGKATFTVSDSTAEAVTYTATVNGSTQISPTAQVTFTAVPSASNSTVVASPTTVTADGSASSTITVTVRDSGSNPIQGLTVSLSPSGGSSTITTVQGTTDASGVATFTVADATAESVTYSATVSGTIQISQIATVTFQAPSPDATQSTVGASPTTVAADGTSFSTVTVTVKDSGGVLLQGVTVSLAGNGGTSSTVTAVNGTTDSTGKATFEVTDTTAESVTYTATAGGTIITQTASVTFTTPTVDASQSQVAAVPSSVPADGSSSSVITVTATDSGGVPLQGIVVSLGQGTGHSVVTTLSGTTDASGKATFEVKDTTVESVIYTATAGGTVITQTAAVNFTTPTPDAGQSTVLANPTSVNADGLSASTITVTVNDSGGAPISGETVTLSPSGGSSTITTVQGTTDSTGKAIFSVSDSIPETVTYTASAGGTTLTQTAQVTFTPSPSASQSTVSASPTTVPADGASQSTITVTVNDGSGAPIQGVTVSLGQGTGNSTITAVQSTTDASGHATFTVADATAESVTYTATANGTAITPTASVTFTTPTVDAALSTVAANPSSVPADGSTPSAVTVTVNDSGGVPMQGVTVTLAAGGGSSTVTTVQGTTGVNGQATFNVADAVPETVTYTATAAATQITQTAPVTFTPVPNAGLSTVSAGPTSIPADGTITSTITVTVNDGSGSPIQGLTVTLAPGGGSSTVTTVQGTTDSTGKATFTVTDSTAEAVTYTATASGTQITQTATVTFQAPTVDAGLSTVVANPTSVLDDGTTQSTITVTVKDSGGVPMQGVTVTLAGNGATSSTVTTVQGTTNLSGVATFKVADATPESVTYTATAAATPITQTTTVSFAPAPPSGGGSGPVGNTPNSVGQTGGTLQTSDGGFTMNVPSGGLTGGTTLTVTESSTLPTGMPNTPGGFTTGSQFFTLSGANLTSPGMATFTYDPGTLGSNDPNLLSVWFDDTWEYVPSTIDATTHTITVRISKAGTYVVLANLQTFSDIPSGYWAKGAIDATLAAGIVTGYPDGTFRPNDDVTRAEFVVMLMKILGLPADVSATQTFTDVPASAWYAGYLDEAASVGIMTGAGGKANPDQLLSREEAAVLLMRAATYAHLTGHLGTEPSSPPGFKDEASIGAWAQGAVSQAVLQGLISGYPDGTFKPLGTLTRAEAAALIDRLLQLEEQPPTTQPM